MRLSIRWKLIFSIAGPLVIIAFLVMWLTIDLIYDYSVQQRIDQATRLAESYAGRLDDHFRILSQVSHDAAAYAGIDDALSEEEIYNLLHSNLLRNSRIYGSAIAFEPYKHESQQRLFSPYAYKQGDVIRIMDIAERAYDYTKPQYEWFVRTRETRQPVWTEPYFDEGAGDILMVTYAVPFFRNGEFNGVATVDVSLEDLQQQVSQTYLHDQPFILVSKAGHLISHPDPEMIMKGISRLGESDLDAGTLRQLDKEMSNGNAGVIRIASLSFISDEPYWIFYAPLYFTGWSLATAVPESEMLSFLDQQITRGVIGLLIMVVCVVVSILVVGSRITRPIAELAGAANQLAEGNFSVKLEPGRSQDEIGDLTRAFNHMIDQLDRHLQTIKRETSSRQAVESELRIAREIQTSLLPDTYPPFPDRKEFDLAAVNVPAKHIAGDFFDYLFIDKDTLLFLVADVSGKGAPSAIVMAITRTIIRNIARSGVTPSSLLNQTNAILLDTRISNTFVTVFLGIYKPASGELLYANAGHQPPFLLDPLHGVTKLGEATGTIIGMLEDIQIEDRTTTLQPGQSLVIYTDGIPEARNPDGLFFSDAQFKVLLDTCKDMTAYAASRHVLDTVSEFQAQNLADDITMLILKRNQTGGTET